MALVNAAGTVLSNSAVKALASTVSQPTVYSFNEDVYETFTHPGDSRAETRKRKKYYKGQVVSGAAIDALDAYQASTVTSVTPSTLATAGGQVVTIVGTNFTGVTSVTFGGTAGTSLVKLSSKKIQVTSPAKTAGSHAVVVVGGNGNTAAGNVTYA